MIFDIPDSLFVMSCGFLLGCAVCACVRCIRYLKQTMVISSGISDV